MRTGRRLARFLSSGAYDIVTPAFASNPAPYSPPSVDIKSRCHAPSEVAPGGWRWAAVAVGPPKPLAAAAARGLLRCSAVWLCAAVSHGDALKEGTNVGTSRRVQEVQDAISAHLVSCVEPTIAGTLTPEQVREVAGLFCDDADVKRLSREHATRASGLEPYEKDKLTGYLRKALQQTKRLRHFTGEREKAAVAVFYVLLDPDAASPPAAVDTALSEVFAWMTKSEVCNLLDQVHTWFLKNGRRYFAENHDIAKRERYIERNVPALMSAINESYLSDWEVHWDDAAFDRLLCSVYMPTAADLWLRYGPALTDSLAQFDRRAIFSSILDFHPLDRFVAPESKTLVDLLGSKELIAMCNILGSRVGVMTGESGSGKTVTALQVAAREGRLVLFLKANEAFSRNDAEALRCQGRFRKSRRRGWRVATEGSSDTQIIPRHEEEKARKKRAIEDRNERVKNCLENAVDKNVNPQNLPLEASPVHVTVVIDEMGGYPEELRGLCASRRNVVDALEKKLKVASVQLICVGTGLGTGQHIGSQPDTFHRYEMRPFLWEHFRPTLTKDTKDDTSPKGRMLALLLDKTKRHPELVWIRELLQNARFTAIFMERLRTAFAPPYSQDKVSLSEAALIGGLLFLAQQALLRFFDLNGLCNHPKPQKAIRDALQLMLDRSRVGVNWSDLAVSYGIATCSAVVVKGKDKLPGGEPVNPNQKDEGTGLEMIFIGRAYVHVSSAYCAMFLVLVGGASPRPLTPTGFELAIADYATLCASFFLRKCNYTSENRQAVMWTSLSSCHHHNYCCPLDQRVLGR